MSHHPLWIGMTLIRRIFYRTIVRWLLLQGKVLIWGPGRSRHVSRTSLEVDGNSEVRKVTYKMVFYLKSTSHHPLWIGMTLVRRIFYRTIEYRVSRTSLGVDVNSKVRKVTYKTVFYLKSTSHHIFLKDRKRTRSSQKISCSFAVFLFDLCQGTRCQVPLYKYQYITASAWLRKSCWTKELGCC